MQQRDLARDGEGLTVAHEEAPDSFGLHAPLELMARTELLAKVSSGHRAAALSRIAQIETNWEAAGTPVPIPDGTAVRQPLASLTTAIQSGDVDAADRAFAALCATRTADEIVGDLADVALQYLGGAAHAPIFLELLPRFVASGFNPALMGRTLVRSIAGHPDWVIKWVDQPRPGPSPTSNLEERLRNPQSGQPSPSTSIHPTMALIDESGLAFETLADVTAGLTPIDAQRRLSRIAAMSMLQDDPDHAPYGWSHCLTMPQAALAIAHRSSDPQRAIDVAATYVLGFRATLSSTAIDDNWVPQANLVRQSRDIVSLVPKIAAATAWRTFAADRASVLQQLIDNAAIHPDAHLAKYTLACLDAIEADPSYTHLYMAAAAFLAAWWHHNEVASPAAGRPVSASGYSTLSSGP